MTTHFRLGDAVPRDAIEDVCHKLGFRLANVVARAPHHPAQSIFVTADRRTTLHLLEDEAAGRAVVLQGARAEELVSAMLRELTGASPPRREEGGPAAGDAGSAPAAERGDSGDTAAREGA